MRLPWLMIHPGCDVDTISLELNQPIEQVAMVISKMDEVRAACRCLIS